MLKKPALLAGMSHPQMNTHWEKIGDAGFSNVVCLCDSQVTYNPYPLKEMDEGEGIVVHCVGGIGRTGTVLGCVLRYIGFSADEVISYLDDLNAERGFGSWPETEWQGEMILRY